MSRQLLLRQYMHEICTSSWRTPLGSVEGTEHRKSCPRSKAPFSEKRVNPQCSLPRPSRKKWHILATACLSAALASGVATRAPCQKYVESRQAPRNSNPQRCTTLAFEVSGQQETSNAPSRVQETHALICTGPADYLAHARTLVHPALGSGWSGWYDVVRCELHGRRSRWFDCDHQVFYLCLLS